MFQIFRYPRWFEAGNFSASCEMNLLLVFCFVLCIFGFFKNHDIHAQEYLGKCIINYRN